MSTAEDLKNLLPSDVKIFRAGPQSVVRIMVEVSQISIPYTVAYAGRTIIKSLVNCSEVLEPLVAGTERIGWAFAHVLKGWSHAISIGIDDQPPVVLEKKSEANKDPDHSVGVAFLVVE